MHQRIAILGTFIGIFVFILVLSTPAQTPNLEQQVQQLQREVEILRKELSQKPTWGQTELKSAVNEIIDSEWFVLENGRLRRIHATR